jgi:hypothetical protein
MLGAARFQPRNRSLKVSSWWQDPGSFVALFSGPDGDWQTCDWYHIVDAFLGIESRDLCFRTRFNQLYGDFQSNPPQVSKCFQGLRCRVQVRDGAPANLVTFTAPEEVAIVDFILDLYRERGYVEMHDAASDWRSVGLEGAAQPLLTARGAHVLVDRWQLWQPLIATCAINWVMRMQRDFLFFHAAAVGISGNGVLIAGDKAAGKSTTSMALAAQGHQFLGDEISVVRSQTLELCPFRRAVSIRPGPQARQVEQILNNTGYATERFPDGTTRKRVEAGNLFPQAGTPLLPLRWVFFLCGFEDFPRAEAFVPRSADLRLLAPLPCTFWGASPARLMMQVAKLLSSVKCYLLHPGLPEDTAKLVEGIVRTG